jgi:hypothetical protein
MAPDVHPWAHADAPEDRPGVATKQTAQREAVVTRRATCGSGQRESTPQSAIVADEELLEAIRLAAPSCSRNLLVTERRRRRPHHERPSN